MMDDRLTKKIIKCAYSGHNVLGFGFLEKVYENSMLIEFSKLGLKGKQQHPITVKYDGQEVGSCLADILAEDEIVVEITSISALAKEHEVQLVNFLKATDKPVGLLINFGCSVEVRRKTPGPEIIMRVM
jgi:GxxExxY protein